ncbi:CARDB domain-containing protein [Hymenobacter properus]|uniref:Right-handed parallel beta-helix repeat-containing protein n=1 Tax=Hymenobacter properus TaxID=2791026 RepID=A0A931FKM5_9BACT|nr:right-handed parallel beta-helix repeat-containing protein [Hymenobacter properus]MBF9144102.1 right-handed parallel beta-helix repeat-containing protein [Hymenobacter properus]MBR7722918.1 right-handed parallel beta-helix repeat-containing protein [Microvirga sp. SRT04]
MLTAFTRLLCQRGRAAGVLVALLLSGPAALAQLSGAYTINSAQPTGGTNYASFGAAASDLATRGVSGPVTFSVSGGPYVEQLRLPAIAGSSATNRITFDGNGRTIQFQATVAAEPAVITLNGADFVTLNNLTVVATGGATGTYGWGIQLVNNADDNVVSNCTVTCNTTASCAGIVSAATATSMTSTGTTASQKLTLSGNTVNGGTYGIVAMGNTSSAPTPGIVMTNNTVRDFYRFGIYIGALSGPQLIGNEVTRPTLANPAAYYGIYLASGVSGAAVEKNRLHTAFVAGAQTYNLSAYGIYVSTGTAATATAPNDFVNNLVYDIVTTGTTNGIFNVGANYNRYYHNSIDITTPIIPAFDNAYGYYQLQGTNVEFKNNVVNMNRGGAKTQYAIFLSVGTPGSIASDYNCLSGQGSTFVTGNIASTDYPTLAAWQAAAGGLYDPRSTAANPGFENLALGNLKPTSSPLDGRALPLARVPQDVTGAVRSTTAPDMGAYEFTAPALDVALLRIDSPASPVTLGSTPVTVTILNNGTSPLTSVQLQYVLNGGTPVVQTFALSPALPAAATQSLTFSTQPVLVAGPSTVTVTASLPNGLPDTNPNNNTQTTTAYPSLRGTYTINKQQPTGGTNFASFTDAAASLNGGGVSGTVRLNVLNGPYVEPFVLGVVAGVSATDTIVVDGGSSKQTLRFDGSATQRGVVSLLATDYVTLKNLTIDASNDTLYSNAVQLVGAAENNRIADCVIRSSPNAPSSAGISATNPLGSAVPVGNANNLRIERNSITGSQIALQLGGVSGSNRLLRLRVTDNEVRDFASYGINVTFSSGSRVIGNNVHRSALPITSAGMFYGMYCFNNINLAIESNRIHDPFMAGTATTTSAYGIYIIGNNGAAGQENDVVNNLIYNFNGNAAEYGLYNSGSSFCRYYHNTVSLDNTAYTGNANCYGFYQTTAATNVDFRNNLVSVTRGGTGSRYALYFDANTSTITSNYNDLYVGTGAGFYTGYFNTNQATLADWKAVNNAAYDQNSLQTMPLFTAPATGNLRPTGAALDGAGTPAILARVPRDFTGALRGSTPDIGAYEFSAVPNDVVLLSIDAPATTGVLGNNPVMATIYNNGTAVLNTVTLTYAVNNGATPASNAQTFSGLSLAPGAGRQLTFTTGITLTQTGTYTLTVTSSLPNGQPDGQPSNDARTITFDQMTLANDEPCGALPLTGQLSGSTVLATTSTGGGIGNALPTCSGAQLPRDAWYTLTPTGSSLTLYTSGAGAGLVRLFTASTCSSGFVQVFCQASAGAGQSLGTVTIPNLTAGQRYYLAVSGYASTGTGTFTLGLTPLGTRSPLEKLMQVYPNPVTGGELTLDLGSARLGAGTVSLLNALGQTVRMQPLMAGAQRLVTRGLAAGLYTLRVQSGPEVLTRKVAVEQ